MSSRLLPVAAILLAASACAGPPPAAQPANDTAPVGSMGAPAAPAPAQTLAAQVPPADAADPVATAKAEADYLGRWTGPEGLLLDVTAKPGGGVTIDNQYTLDDRGRFEGSVTAAGLRFTRAGTAVTARPTDGDGTGMKWLAGKRDCLVVIVGSEGYCRR